MPGSKPRRLRRPGQRVVGGEVAQAVELARRLDRAHRLVRERAQRLQLSVGGQQAVLGVVDPDHAEEPAVAVVQRHDEPVVVPGARPAAVVDRGVDAVDLGRRAALGLGGVHHDAAVGQEGGVEQRRQDVERERREARDLLGREADARERHKVPAGVVGEEHHHLLEAERLADAVADGVEHLLRRVAARELGGHAQEVLDGGAVAAALGGALGLLEGDGDVRGDGAEQLELDLGGAAAGQRLVDRDDAEHLAGRGPQRHHQRVVGVPRARVVDDRDVGRVGPQAVTAPVVLAGGHEVGAVAEEARGDQHVPVRPPRGLAHQQLLRLLVAEHDDHLEVVPGRAVEVDHDRAVAERAGDGGGHRCEHGRQRVAAAHGRGDVEQAAQAVEGGGLAEPGREVAHPGRIGQAGARARP